MAVLRMSYSEIMDRDFTAVTAMIETEQGEIVACFRNYDPEECEIYGNQIDVFPLPSVEVGLAMFQGNKDYHRVPLAELDLEGIQNSESPGYSSALEEIRINTNKGLIEAKLVKGESYSGISISVDGQPAALVECCEDNRLVAWVYEKEQDTPVKVNLTSGEVTIPKSWSGELRPN